MAHLEFHEGDDLLFVHLLHPRGRTIIGRSDRTDVALPSDSVSRTHCIVERRTEGWWLSDKSSHGTYMHGEKITRHHLSHFDVFQIGQYRVRFVLNSQESSTESQVLVRRQMMATTSKIHQGADHEELLGVTESGVATQRGVLEFTRGPLGGKTILLTSSRTTVGGKGAQIVLDSSLPKVAARIRVVRGRIMIEPGEHACFLAGTRVREITPARKGEEVRIGEHGFAIKIQTTESKSQEPQFGQMIGDTPVMRQLFGILNKVSAHNHLVLLTGESGTGKELAARGIHLSSPRADGPFITINCAGIPETLFESELFGHEKGAFTGAAKRQDGAFQYAHGGTLFLDEIGELPLNAQAKLLRVLESGEVRRVGSHETSCPDVRVVAATNRNLQRMVQEKTFREDLYFRLVALAIRLPPLRDRKEDIPVIAKALLHTHHDSAELTEDAIEALRTYHWPGNVRELRNVLTRAYVLGGPSIGSENLAFNPWSFEDQPNGAPLSKKDMEQQEREAIILALQQSQGNKSKAARTLGMPRTSLIYKMQRFAIQS